MWVKIRRLTAMSTMTVALLASASLAQQNRAALTSYNNTYIVPNGRGAITGSILNVEHNNFINSFGVMTDVNLWTGTNNFTGSIQLNGASPNTANGLAALDATGAFAGNFDGTFTGQAAAVFAPLSSQLGGL